MTDEDGIDGPFERGMSRIPAARGVCPTCERTRPVTAKGVMRRHFVGIYACAGSGKPPRSP